MTKKIICAFLITTTMLSFAACAGDEGNNEEATEATVVTEKATEEVTEETTEDSTGLNFDSSEEELAEFLKNLEIETKDDEETSVYAEDMVGKTFAELLDNGYEYIGYSGWGEDYSFLVTMDIANDEATDIVKKLEGKTVKDLVDEDLDIGYMGMNGQYIFSTTIGDMEFQFDIDGAADIVKKYKEEDSFADIEDMTELYDIPLSNVEFSKTTYTLKFDDSFDASKFKDGDDFKLDDPEEQLKDCVVKELYCKSIPEGLFD